MQKDYLLQRIACYAISTPYVLRKVWCEMSYAATPFDDDLPPPPVVIDDGIVPPLPEGVGIVVCRRDWSSLSTEDRKRSPHLERVANVTVPLVERPDLVAVRRELVAEFPHAAGIVDRILRPLAGRDTVYMPPVLFVGSPGSGKSRFGRRLAESLGLHVFRVDGGRETASSFGGCERRWNTGEACHPLAAIAQGGHANPAILLDEIEKAGTGTQNGRLWDALLGFLERENAARYPDPFLQSSVDLSHVSYIATANRLAIPAPLADRFRIIDFPSPKLHHLPALLPSIVADAAEEHGLGMEWIEPMTGQEIAAIERTWTNGSLRSLRRIVEGVLIARDLAASRN